MCIHNQFYRSLTLSKVRTFFPICGRNLFAFFVCSAFAFYIQCVLHKNAIILSSLTILPHHIHIHKEGPEEQLSGRERHGPSKMPINLYKNNFFLDFFTFTILCSFHWQSQKFIACQLKYIYISGFVLA